MWNRAILVWELNLKPRKYRLHLTWKVYCVILLKLFYSQLCNHYLQWGKKKMEIRRGNLLHGKRKRTKQLLQQKPIPAIEFQISKEFLWISLIGSKIPRPRGWKLKSQLGHKSRYWCASLHSCLTLCDPGDCSPPSFSVQGILQARLLEWVAMPSSGRSSQPRNQTRSFKSPALAGGFFTTSATWG